MAVVGSTYFELGAAIATPAMLYELQDGTCQPAPGVPDGSYFDLGSEVALADLASLHDVAITDGRIVEHGWVDDGGQLIARNASLHDTQLDVDVEPQSVDASTLVLAPRDLAAILLFADATCHQPLVGADHRPQLATLDRSDGGCPVRQLFEVGEQVHPAQVFEGQPGSCTPATLPPMVFAVGPELPASTFVALVIQRD